MAARGHHLIVGADLEQALAQRGVPLAVVADRAGFDPEDLQHIPLNELPASVLARLAEALDSTASPTPQSQETDTDRQSDSSTLGAYIAELAQGATRDALAEALNWTLTRLERALSALDHSLQPCGMRLAFHAGRITIVGRLERTHPTTFIDLARLDATPELDPEMARIVWQSLAGLRATDLETWGDADLEAFKTAERLHLVFWRYGQISLTAQVKYSLTRQLSTMPDKAETEYHTQVR